VQGGISNGMPLDVRIVFKPTATVLCPSRPRTTRGTTSSSGQGVAIVRFTRAIPSSSDDRARARWLAQRGQVGDRSRIEGLNEA
jgi:hypothetical protein